MKAVAAFHSHRAAQVRNDEPPLITVDPNSAITNITFNILGRPGCLQKKGSVCSSAPPERSAGNPSVHLTEQSYGDYGSEVGCSRFLPVMENPTLPGEIKHREAKVKHIISISSGNSGPCAHEVRSGQCTFGRRRIPGRLRFFELVLISSACSLLLLFKAS